MVVDWYDRETIRGNFVLRGRAKEEERALESVRLDCFGFLGPVSPSPVFRSFNGLISQSHCFRQVCRDCRVAQELILPYTPQQNGLNKGFFWSFKEECPWPHKFPTFEKAQPKIIIWMRWYNEKRSNQALEYRSLSQHQRTQALQVA